ncbi:MAG TPA: respiratory nitrate reductase subunit gamma, partial [Devosia sp.]|nr:respiratory nitrate reductase subunit gamma [Devosia sp.]
MDAFLNSFLFGIYPYIALTVLALGSIVRYDHEPYTWKSGSSQLLRRKQLYWGSLLFHLGVLAIFGGHLVGLLTPIWIWDMLGVAHGTKQLIAIGLGGVAGVMGIVGATLLIHRRFFDARVRANSSFSDNAVILLLWAQLALGLGSIFVSMQHLDGHEMVKLMSWAQGIFSFDSNAAGYISETHWIFKTH